MGKILDFQAKKAEQDKYRAIYQDLRLKQMKRICNKLFEPIKPKHKDYTSVIKR